MGRVAKQGEGKDSVCLLSAMYCVRKQRSVYEECWGGVESGAGGGAGRAGRVMQGQGCQLRLTSVSGTIASGSNVIMRTQEETRYHFSQGEYFYDT